VTEQQHHDDDLLLALALDDVTEPERETALQHLSHCAQCRVEYDALSATIERTLAAAPSVEPEPGFDRRALERMGFVSGVPEVSGARRTPVADAPRDGGVRRTLRRPARWQLAAASVVLGLGIGTATTYALTRAADTGGPPAVTAQASSLWTKDGVQVGTVTRGYAEGHPVFVVTVKGAPVGMDYQCRVRLSDGTKVAIGEWTIESAEGQTWVVDAPAGNAKAMELVANAGAGPVWSKARL
jgi:hypothetical protein